MIIFPPNAEAGSPPRLVVPLLLEVKWLGLKCLKHKKTEEGKTAGNRRVVTAGLQLS
jgi:hypothetical protein